jgi:hypothetical protein
MTNQNIANVVITILNEIEVDGETMEYIIDKMGMRDQMIKQLVTDKVKYNLEQTSQNDDLVILKRGEEVTQDVFTFTEAQLVEFTQMLMDQALNAAKESIRDSGVDMESYVELDIYDRNIEVSIDDVNIYKDIISNLEDAFGMDDDDIKDQMKSIFDHINKV